MIVRIVLLEMGGILDAGVMLPGGADHRILTTSHNLAQWKSVYDQKPFIYCRNVGDSPMRLADSIGDCAVSSMRGCVKRLFPGVDPKKPLNNIRKVWMRALASAKVKHARIHDLRHSFASAAATAGVNLYTIQRMLGHSGLQTT